MTAFPSFSWPNNILSWSCKVLAAFLTVSLKLLKILKTIFHIFTVFLPLFLKRFYLFIFRQRRREEEIEEKNINVWLPLMWPPLGTGPTTQACAPTGNRTGDALFASHAPSTEPHQPGLFLPFETAKNVILHFLSRFRTFIHKMALLGS